MKHNCRWVLRPASPGVDAIYCEKPVKYKMVRDDDQNLVRKYNAFCDEHQKKAQEQKDEDY